MDAAHALTRVRGRLAYIKTEKRPHGCCVVGNENVYILLQGTSSPHHVPGDVPGQHYVYREQFPGGLLQPLESLTS